MRAWLLALVAVCGAAQAADEVSFVNEGVVPAPIGASFPFEEAWKRAWSVIQLTPTDNGTHLRVTSYGYGIDEESLAMRRFFEAGNQQTIETIRRHFGAPAP